MRLLPILLLMLVSGCSSIFGDRFRDRADDYIKAREMDPIVDASGNTLSGQDHYPVPELVGVAAPDTFEVPRPTALGPADTAEDDESLTLTEYQSKALNARLERDGSGSQVLRMDTGFAYSWAVISEALAKTDLKVTDVNRSVGTWYLQLLTPQTRDDLGWWSRLWGDEPGMIEKPYRLKLNRGRSGTYLSLLEDDDRLASDEQTSKVLSAIEKHLGK